MPTSGPHRRAKPSEERIRPIIVERATMERRSPTGIARERETSADNAAPCQRQAHTAGQSPAKNAYDRSSSSARQWSAGLRPASRGSAKPAPITLRHANVRPTPLGKAQRRTHTTDHRRARDNGTPVSDRHRGPQGRETPQRTTLTAHATQVQQVPSVPSVLISDPSVEITTFWSCSASPDFTYHSQRAPSGSVTQVSVFSA